MTRLALLGAVLTSATTVTIAIAVGAAGAPAGPGLERPLVGAVLFTAPAAIGLAGAWRREPALLVAAGMLCLLQSVVPFSGVALVYLPAALAFFLASSQEDAGRTSTARWTPRGAFVLVVVSVVLAVLIVRFTGVAGVVVVVIIGGLARRLQAPRSRRVPFPAGSAVVGALVVALVIAGWMVAAGSTREVCWVERQGAGGPVRETIAAGDDPPFLVGGDVVATGCDTGVPTTEGVLLALALAGLALGAALVAPVSPRHRGATAT